MTSLLSTKGSLFLTKRVLLAVSLAAGIGLIGCTSQVTMPSSEPAAVETSEEADTKGKKKVLTTFTVLADMAQNVAGDQLEVESITRIGAEI
ncbi:MAG: hypothetical protein AAF722_15690, partial [Cyanobacteria bacterium P01_C01_bin.70]